MLENPPLTLSSKLYLAAKACLGYDMVSPGVDPAVGCASAVNAVYKRAFGKEIGGGSSTQAMYAVLKADSRFREVAVPLQGDIVISPTGSSSIGSPHGHVGIMGLYGILSNNSMNGLWQEYYTVQSWQAYYGTRLGFPMLFFRCV